MFNFSSNYYLQPSSCVRSRWLYSHNLQHFYVTFFLNLGRFVIKKHSLYAATCHILFYLKNIFTYTYSFLMVPVTCHLKSISISFESLNYKGKMSGTKDKLRSTTSQFAYQCLSNCNTVNIIGTRVIQTYQTFCTRAHKLRGSFANQI